MKIEVIKGVIFHNNIEYSVGKTFVCSNKDGSALVDAGVAKEIKSKRNSRKKTKAKKLSIEEEGMFYHLQEEAKALGIDIEGKNFEELKKEVDGLEE